MTLLHRLLLLSLFLCAGLQACAAPTDPNPPTGVLAPRTGTTKQVIPDRIIDVFYEAQKKDPSGVTAGKFQEVLDDIQRSLRATGRTPQTILDRVDTLEKPAPGEAPAATLKRLMDNIQAQAAKSGGTMQPEAYLEFIAIYLAGTELGIQASTSDQIAPAQGTWAWLTGVVYNYVFGSSGSK